MNGKLADLAYGSESPYLNPAEGGPSIALALRDLPDRVEHTGGAPFAIDVVAVGDHTDVTVLLTLDRASALAGEGADFGGAFGATGGAYFETAAHTTYAALVVALENYNPDWFVEITEDSSHIYVEFTRLTMPAGSHTIHLAVDIAAVDPLRVFRWSYGTDGLPTDWQDHAVAVSGGSNEVTAIEDVVLVSVGDLSPEISFDPDPATEGAAFEFSAALTTLGAPGAETLVVNIDNAVTCSEPTLASNPDGLTIGAWQAGVGGYQWTCTITGAPGAADGRRSVTFTTTPSAPGDVGFELEASNEHGFTGSASGSITVATTWSVDATSGKACPADASEWSAFMSALGFGSAPSHLWGCQDVGHQADSIGGVPLNAWGTLTGVTYQTPIPGWSRGAIYMPGVGGGWRAVANAVTDPSVTSVAMLVYARVQSSGGQRTHFYINDGGAASADSIACYINNVTDVRAVCDGVITASPLDHTGVVRPYLLVYNRSEGSCRLYTDRGCVATTYSGAIASGSNLGLARSTTASSGTVDYLYACVWEGTAAEFTPAQARALIDGLGFDTSAWWTADTLSKKVVPSNLAEWRSLLTYHAIDLTYTPSYLHLCQEASGNLADSIGTLTLTAFGSPAYNQAVPGWSRLGVKGDALTASQRFAISTAAAPDPSTTSIARLALVYANGYTSTVREVLSNGSNSDVSVQALDTGGGPRYRYREGSNIVQSGVAHEGVSPVMLVVDHANARARLATHVELLSPAYGAPASATNYTIGAISGTWADCTVMYEAGWSGAAAEMPDTVLHALLSALNWEPAWAP